MAESPLLMAIVIRRRNGN